MKLCKLKAANSSSVTLMVAAAPFLWGLWHLWHPSNRSYVLFPLYFDCLLGWSPVINDCVIFTGSSPLFTPAWCLVAAEYWLTAWGEGVQEILLSLRRSVDEHISSSFFSQGNHRFCPPPGRPGSSSKNQTRLMSSNSPLSTFLWPLKHLHNKFAGHCFTLIFSFKYVLARILELCWTFYSVNKWRPRAMAAQQIDHPEWGHGTNLGQAFIRSRAGA